MKLAEALLLRADRQRTLAQLKARAEGAARYQEGEEPAEDANRLLVTATEVLDELEDLIERINRTNSASTLTDGTSLTAALAERDVLRLRYALLAGVADAAAGRGSTPAFGRQIRSELRYLTSVSVPQLRDQANTVAQRSRELNGRIQEANWTIDLIED